MFICKQDFTKKKIAVHIALAIGISSAATETLAALPSGATLNILSGTTTFTCQFGTGAPSGPNGCAYNGTVTNVNGSFFQMDTDGNGFANDLEQLILPANGGQIIIGQTQSASGSHGGPIDGTESPAFSIWEFFGNTGMDYTTSPVVDNGNDTATMSGWRVAWNTIPAIDMGGGPQNCGTASDGICVDNFGNDIAGTYDNGTGIGSLICNPTPCATGSTFVIDYNAIVPQADPSNFGGVAYKLHVEGTVSLPGTPPTTMPDSANTIIGNPVTIDVLSNDSSADGLDVTSVVIDTQGTDGVAAPNPDGTITYTPDTVPANFQGMDSFLYTVDSTIPVTSAPETVNVDVQTNVPPVTSDDLVTSNTVAFENAGGMLVVDVLGNDNDANNGPDLPGGIDTTTTTVLSQPAPGNGTCTANPDGTITYSQPLPTVAVTDTCTYEVRDVDTFGTPLPSNVGTIDINVSDIQSDWDAAMDTDATIPVLLFDPGVPNASGNTADIPASGTYFSMDVDPFANPPVTIYPVLTPGSDGGLIIGHEQTASGSHTGLPTGNEVAPLDLGWNFFGNTGMTWHKNGGIGINPNGTLKFDGDPAINGGQGRYQITWNGIPEIDLGGSPDFPADLGFATINCDTVSPVDPAKTAFCAHGDFFELDYAAHVPLGDPSGFGGVQYRMRMTGTVSLLDGALQSSDGTISSSRMTATALNNPDVDPDPTDSTPAGVIAQCVGDCFDYTITAVTMPSVSVVMPLAAGVPASYVDGAGNTIMPVMRVFNGTWNDFDTSMGDTVESAAAVAGGPGMQCPPPGDVAYNSPMTAGHQCVQVTIADDGPNDKAMGLGTITDPSGLGVPVGAAFVDNRTSGSSGCSVATMASTPLKSGAWVLLSGFVALLGWKRRKRQQ